MNKKILRQALKFKSNQNPPYSKIEDLALLASKYEQENEVYFLKARRGKRASILNESEFFKFISDEVIKNRVISSFEDINNILNAKSRGDNIRFSGDSKTNFIRVFDRVILAKKKGELVRLYQREDLYLIENIKTFVLIENGETFLNIEKIADKFDCEYFIYLSGNPNSLTREFLKDKEVIFFIDYDIVSMNIFEDFISKKKSLFIPKNIKSIFEDRKNRNIELYKKQRRYLRENYSREVMPIVELIKTHQSVIEQEDSRLL